MGIFEQLNFIILIMNFALLTIFLMLILFSIIIIRGQNKNIGNLLKAILFVSISIFLPFYFKFQYNFFNYKFVKDFMNPAGALIVILELWFTSCSLLSAYKCYKENFAK